jgi:hypothetical protein
MEENISSTNNLSSTILEDLAFSVSNSHHTGLQFNYNMLIYLSSVIIYCNYIRYMNRNKTISISQENYNQLRKFGYAGQSLNQAIGKLLAIAAGGKSD